MNQTAINSTFGRVFHRGLLATTVAVIGAMAVYGDHHQGDRHTDADAAKPETFIKEAGKMNAGTVKLSKLGSEKASSEQLKEFASKMETEHKKIQDRLKELAEKKDVTIPTSLEAKHQELHSRLQQLSGEEFDKEFAKVMLKGHTMAVKKLEKASEKVEDTELKQFVNATLPEMKEHKKEAREMAKAVGLDEQALAAIEKEDDRAVGSPGSITVIERGIIIQPAQDPERDAASSQDAPPNPPAAPRE